jgi:tRNA(fMet)-specific endonuclease VapC
MQYLLDTNICIYFLKGKYNLVQKFDEIGFANLYISEITVAELKFGAEKSDNPNKNRPVVNKLISKFRLIPIYNSLDVFAFEKARLRKSGTIIDDFDLLIGSTAVYN